MQASCVTLSRDEKNDDMKRRKVGKREKKGKLRLGYRESNPGLLREQSLLSSESQRCYRYTIPD